jgi:hypothetical protein
MTDEQLREEYKALYAVKHKGAGTFTSDDISRFSSVCKALEERGYKLTEDEQDWVKLDSEG